MEIWKDIEEYEGLYQVSNHGNIKSMKYYGGKTVKLLKLSPDKNGYLCVGLYKNCKIKKCKAHRLVAKAFIPNPQNKPQINHIDENVKNNMYSNLEWCDAKYNCNYGEHNFNAAKAQTGKKHTKQHIKKIRDNAPGKKPVLMLDKESLKIIKKFKSASDGARYIGGKATNVIKNCKDKIHTYKGYVWKYDKGVSNNGSNY